MKILAIVGSPKENGYNMQLALAQSKCLPDGVEFEIVTGSDLPYMNEDIEFPTPEAVAKLREKVKAADGLWIFTPEHNHSYSGLLKNTFDWLSRPVAAGEGNVITKKPIALSGAGGGISGTQSAQDNLFSYLGFINTKIMTEPRMVVPSAYTMMDAKGIIDFSQYEEKMQKMATAFVDFIKE